MENYRIKNYFSLVTFSHTVFALPFAFIGFFLALHTHQSTPFNWIKLLLMVLCMILARNAAMAFNRYVDRKFDAQNSRTQHRELPAGVMKPREALIFMMVNALLFVVCTWFINRLCFFLSPVALGVILGYSFTKRFTALCHLVLGVGLALAPIGAYLVVAAHFALLPLLYSFTVLCWVSGFDIIYALQDAEFDAALGLHSIPARIGNNSALWLAKLLHLFAFIGVVIPFFITSFTWFYVVGVVFFGMMLIWQHCLVKANDLSKVNKAFFTTNGIASLVFALFFLLDVWWKSIGFRFF